MKILDDKYLAAYRQQLTTDINGALAAMNDATQITTQSFTFYTSVAVK